MEDQMNENKEEVSVDFGEDLNKAEPELTLEDLDKQAESIDNQQQEEMKLVKQLADENKEKIDSAVQLPSDTSNLDENSVFVKDLSLDVTPDELLKYFSSCGNITRLKILTGKTGAPKGMAYIEFSDPECAKSALMFSGNKLHDKELHVLPKRKNLPRFMLKSRGRPYYRGRGGYHRGGYRPY